MASDAAAPPREPRGAFYAKLLAETTRTVSGQEDAVSNTANVAALVYRRLREAFGDAAVNWAGFYYARPVAQADAGKRVLMLGPFHGKPAVVRIPYGKGVCGTTAESGAASLVPDVHKVPNHIACDAASQSEVVLPVRSADGALVAVLDLDSPTVGGFAEDDRDGLQAVADAVGKACDWTWLQTAAVPLVPGEEDEGVACQMSGH